MSRANRGNTSNVKSQLCAHDNKAMLGQCFVSKSCQEGIVVMQC